MWNLTKTNLPSEINVQKLNTLEKSKPNISAVIHIKSVI